MLTLDLPLLVWVRELTQNDSGDIGSLGILPKGNQTGSGDFPEGL